MELHRKALSSYRCAHSLYRGSWTSSQLLSDWESRERELREHHSVKNEQWWGLKGSSGWAESQEDKQEVIACDGHRQIPAAHSRAGRGNASEVSSRAHGEWVDPPPDNTAHTISSTQTHWSPTNHEYGLDWICLFKRNSLCFLAHTVYLNAQQSRVEFHSSF